MPLSVGTSSRNLDVEKTANGLSGIVSVDVLQDENMNIALRYETRTNLEFENSVTQNEWDPIPLPDSRFTVEGYKQRRDLPAIFISIFPTRIGSNIRNILTFVTYVTFEMLRC